MQFAQGPRQQRRADQAEVEPQRIVRDPVQCLLFRRRAHLPIGQIDCAPLRIAAFGDHLASALVEAKQRQRRDQHRSGEQERRGALIKPLQAQPEMQPDAAMHPGHQQHDRDLKAALGLADPQYIELLGIEFFLAEQSLADACANDMEQDQERNAQAKHELQRLDRPPAEFATLVERPDAKPGMGEGRRIEGCGDRQELPEQGVVIDARLHRLDRDIAERVIEEMADQIAEQHQPADQPDLPCADAAQQFACSLLGPRAVEHGQVIHGHHDPDWRRFIP